jgi:plastocyanin
MPSRRHVSALSAVVLAVLVAGCAAVPPEPVTVVAENIAFTPTTITLPVGQGFHLTFENRDGGVPHGLSLQTRTSGVPPKDIWTSEIQAGPSVTEYDLVALTAGPYLLMCPVHPNMQVEIDVS